MVHCCTQWKLSHYGARMVRKPRTVSSMLSWAISQCLDCSRTDNLRIVVTQQSDWPLYWELVCATASSYSLTDIRVSDVCKGFWLAGRGRSVSALQDWNACLSSYGQYVVTHHTINCSSHASDVSDSCRNLVPALNYCTCLNWCSSLTWLCMGHRSKSGVWLHLTWM